MLIESAKKRFKHVFGFDLVEGSKSELYADAVFSQASQVILLFSRNKDFASFCFSIQLPHLQVNNMDPCPRAQAKKAEGKVYLLRNVLNMPPGDQASA
jgi:hypothetical protein